MSRKRLTTKYAGALARPIYLPDYTLGLLGKLEAVEKAANEQANAKLAEKIPLLFSFYGIDSSDEKRWTKLALSLAFSHVPGMQVIFGDPPRRGRHRTWQAGLGDDLIKAVETVRREKGLNIRDAIAVLQKDRSSNWRTYTRANLEARFREAMKRRAMRLRMAELLMRPTNQGLYGLGLAGTPGAARMGTILNPKTGDGK